MSEVYIPVPVSAASEIAQRYHKDVVVILCYDRKHDLLHTTTYGVDAADKILAAELGPVLAKAAGGFTPAAQPFEDFRDAALSAQRVDKLLASAKAILAHLNNRIDEAPDHAKPVFYGVADLHAAITEFEEGR